MPRSLAPLALAVLALAVAGCSLAPNSPGSSALTPNAQNHAAARQAAPIKTPRPNCGRYGACSVEACLGTICFVFGTDGSVQGELTSGITYAQGIAADPRGNSYIADSGAAKILEYGPYLKTLKKTYEDDGQVPLDVDVAAKLKLLAVSNKETASGGAGSVSVYAGGSLSPTATLTDPAVPNAQGIGIAIDRDGNCFWSLYDPDSGNSKIDEFAACAGSPTTIASGSRALRGMAFNKANDLFYVVDVNATHHDIFKCTGTAHCKKLATHFFKPMMINFDDKWGFLWTDDVGVLEAPLIESINPRNGHVTSSWRVGSSTDPPFGIAHVPGPDY